MPTEANSLPGKTPHCQPRQTLHALASYFLQRRQTCHNQSSFKSGYTCHKIEHALLSSKNSVVIHCLGGQKLMAEFDDKLGSNGWKNHVVALGCVTWAHAE